MSLNGDKKKIPYGYFPSTGLVDKHQKKHLIIKAIELIQECGGKVLGITFDGVVVNFATVEELGAKLEDDGVTYSFKVNGQTIYIYPDPSHMIKNVRTTLSKYDLIDGEGRTIKYEYFEKLLKLQEKLDYKIVPKLTYDHVFFDKKPMNVRLAVQLLSNTVANELQNCVNKKIEGFEGAEGTIIFARYFNNIFDACNSQNLEAEG